MNRPFSAWRVGAPYYLPLLLGGMALAPILQPMGFGYISGTLVAAGVFTLFFFRDPQRTISSDTRDIVSPADGTVVAIEDLEESDHYDGPCKRISIFLSVFNVHVNRAPYEGEVSDVLYKEGRYMNAMSAESSKVNESNAIWMTTPHGPMTVRQISGAIARRIVCLPVKGEALEKGQKIGMIKFGSRTELYLPVDTEICTTLKEKVRGGATVLARIPE